MVVLSQEDRLKSGDKKDPRADQPEPPPGSEAELVAPNPWVAQLWWVIPAVVAVVAMLIFAPGNRAGAAREVIAYCAQDQVYSEPIFREFEKTSGSRVRTVYDSEAVKTVGLANRMLAERSHPQCDVFWGNEEMRTRQLAAQGVFRETNGWAAFGYRSRRVVINTNLLGIANAPRSLLELTNAAWAGKIALAYPQFGTTATHFHALRQLWGNAAWAAWCRALAANRPFLADGNSVVVTLVGKGTAPIGLTDSDDIAAGQRNGYPVVALPLGPESLLIPNTVAVIAAARHTDGADGLFKFLQSRPIAETLVAARALEGVSAAEVTTPTLRVNWEKLLQDLESTTLELNRIFLR